MLHKHTHNTHIRNLITLCIILMWLSS